MSLKPGTTYLPVRSTLRASVPAAVVAVGARRGIPVALPSTGGGGGATVDAAALSEFTEQITGPDRVLASAARHIPVTGPRDYAAELIRMSNAPDCAYPWLAVLRRAADTLALRRAFQAALTP